MRCHIHDLYLISIEIWKEKLEKLYEENEGHTRVTPEERK